MLLGSNEGAVDTNEEASGQAGGPAPEPWAKEDGQARDAEHVFEDMSRELLLLDISDPDPVFRNWSEVAPEAAGKKPEGLGTGGAGVGGSGGGDGKLPMENPSEEEVEDGDDKELLEDDEDEATGAVGGLYFIAGGLYFLFPDEAVRIWNGGAAGRRSAEGATATPLGLLEPSVQDVSRLERSSVKVRAREVAVGTAVDVVVVEDGDDDDEVLVG